MTGNHSSTEPRRDLKLRRHSCSTHIGRHGFHLLDHKLDRFRLLVRRIQPDQPGTLADLQRLLDRFVDVYNTHRPHRSLPHQATPVVVYHARPKATPTSDRAGDSHDRVRRDRVDDAGSVTLRVGGRLHHIGVGRTHARTPVLLLVHDLHIRVLNAATGELLRELELDPSKDYQGTGRPSGPAPKQRTGEPTT